MAESWSRLIPKLARATSYHSLQYLSSIVVASLATAAYGRDLHRHRRPSRTVSSTGYRREFAGLRCAETHGRPSDDGMLGSRIGVATVAANAPCEDRCAVRLLAPQVLALGVFDGHGGWQVADWLNHALFQAIASKLISNDGPVGRWDGSPRTVLSALTASFLECDQTLLGHLEVPAAVLKFSKLARIGSCGLCLFVDPSHIFMANAGDSQAFVVRDSKAIRLNSIHNANQPAESLVSKRSLPTRAIGDFFLKDARFTTDHEGADSISEGCTSFPYIDAAPEVKAVPRNPRDEILVVASGGLWEHISAQDVIKISQPHLHQMSREGMPGDTNLVCAQNIADALVQEALQRVAKTHGVSDAEIRNTPLGTERRNFHDDMTVLVVHL